jgi:hypothetical protein
MVPSLHPWKASSRRGRRAGAGSETLAVPRLEDMSVDRKRIGIEIAA